MYPTADGFWKEFYFKLEWVQFLKVRQDSHSIAFSPIIKKKSIKLNVKAPNDDYDYVKYYVILYDKKEGKTLSYLI